MNSTRRLSAELFFDGCCDLGEGPSWDALNQRFVFVDILANTVYCLGEEGAVQARYATPSHIGAALPARDGVLLLVLRDGFAILEADGSITTLLHLRALPSTVRFNDGKCDPIGRAFAGTMAYAETAGAGTLYRLDDGPKATALLQRTTISNGMGWSPDLRTMYFVDSPTQTIAAFDYDIETGALGDGVEFVKIPIADGMPDGLCVDDAGGVWVALFGGSSVRRYTPAGSLDTVIDLPVTQPTSCAFGGRRGDQLMITTARHQLSKEQLALEPYAGGVFVTNPGASAPAATAWKPVTTNDSPLEPT